ncbi:very short patch repair endonuclease [Neisseria gonorrhoeae]|uniref:very short patch repair endonuclease n=1 Tax=Neisseria gonorrhoeae TaxID=485 RepID=UPI000F50ED47|nr:very short patch repair endonuclease [Neisseria gonorrhoeae]ROU63416.1 very short patch repair endonuclease [Neisseria gonorrhoeae]ROV27132.1 very short patch repair endonuclease [Neisseria gonorrhoeae]ROV50971.1 very short patch repair endonuclease [Neisseria gonorrhoeae]RPF89187.1 very short patch repair endonuclease [Neisseria gonorrhoeae]
MDKLTPEQRKKCMQSNKSTGTKPELVLAKAMWALGLRYRKNSGSIFGKPDFSFKKYKVAVFVDGEFWHGKDWEQKKAVIKGNREFWIAKIERNIQRDIEVTGRLKAEGWTVLRFWSNDVVKNTTCCAEKVKEIIQIR